MTKSAAFVFVSFFLSICTPSFAGVLDLNLLDASQFLNQQLPQNVSNEAVKMFGIYTAHRPYTGATSMIDSNTMDILVEGTMVKIGSGLIDALNANGLKVPSFTTPAIPVAKASIRKALSETVDLGLSGLIIKGNRVLGGDLKIVLFHPEEGPSYALRLGYTYAHVPIAYIESCSTFQPELVMSQRLSFVEPYLGIGGRYITGKVKISQPVTVLGTTATVNVTGDGHGTDGYAFTGVFFRLFGAQGLRLGLDGAFDLSGYHTMGIVAGLGF